MTKAQGWIVVLLLTLVLGVEVFNAVQRLGIGVVERAEYRFEELPGEASAMTGQLDVDALAGWRPIQWRWVSDAGGGNWHYEVVETRTPL